MIKTEHTGIYLVAAELPKDKKIRDTYKFVIRQTVTYNAIKKTIKETFIVENKTYNRALEEARDERPYARQRALDKLKGVKSIDVGQTLDDYWKVFVHYKTTIAQKSSWSSGTAYTSSSIYKRHIKPILGKMAVLNIKYSHVQACVLKARDSGAGARVEEQIVALLKTLFTRYFIENGLMDTHTNPAQHQDTRQSKPRQVTLSHSDKKKLFRAIQEYDKPLFRDIFKFLATGRRVNEVLSLRYEHIDGDYYTIQPENNKVGKPMVYKLPYPLAAKESGWVFPSPKDRTKRLTAPALDNHWKRLVKTIGLEGFHKHDIRHLIESDLSDMEVPQETINLVLGHLEVGAKKHYKNETTATADRKAKAIKLFLDGVFKE